MPDVKPGESQNDYMSRCVPMVKDEGATQEQAVGKCLGMYRNATESILYKIDAVLNEAIKRFSLIRSPVSGQWTFVKKPNLPNVLKGKYFKTPDEALTTASKVGIPEEDVAIMEATVVGDVGKEMEQKLCPRNQVWCPKCNACVDRQERTGMGVPVPEEFECPECKKEKAEMWESSWDTPVNVDLSNVTLFFLEAENNAKWKKLNVKDLTQLQKKTHSKMNPRLTHSLKLQVDKMKVKRLWLYVDPYSDYIYNKRELSWAWEKREADQEVQAGWDAIAEKEPWGEKSFGRLKTL